MASQGGTVDWFRFWLKDEEDPDPIKADQYTRWHELRKLQQASEAERKPKVSKRQGMATRVPAESIELVHIQPGKPTQNAHVESFNGRLREECLTVSWFQNLFDARRKITAWQKEYNEERPHSSLGTGHRRSLLPR